MKSSVWLASMVLALLAMAAVPARGLAQADTYFRSNGGVSESRNPLPEQLDEPHCLTWRQPLESGHSTPCVVGDRVFVTAFDGKQLATSRACNLADGKLLWKQVAPATRHGSVPSHGQPGGRHAGQRRPARVRVLRQLRAAVLRPWMASCCGRSRWGLFRTSSARPARRSWRMASC